MCFAKKYCIIENMEKQIEKELSKRNMYNEDDSGKIFLIALVTPILLSLLFTLIATQIANGQEIDYKTVSSNIWFQVSYILINFALYILIYFLYNKTKKIRYNAIKLDFKMKWHTYLLLIGVGVLSLFGIQYFIGAVDKFLELIKYPLDDSLPVINPTGWGSYFASLLLLAVIPAIEEELIFRGIIFNGLRSRFKDYQAILLSAAMFTLMHASLQQFVYPFLLGIIMAWVVMRTGSLMSSIIVHFTNNAIVVTLAFITNMTGWRIDFINKWWFYIISILLLCITFGIYFLIDRYYFKHKSKEDVEKKKTNSKFLIVSLILGVSLFITAIILNFI